MVLGKVGPDTIIKLTEVVERLYFQLNSSAEIPRLRQYLLY
jgi:hypothetical protein